MPHVIEVPRNHLRCHCLQQGPESQPPPTHRHCPAPLPATAKCCAWARDGATTGCLDGLTPLNKIQNNLNLLFASQGQHDM